MVQTLFQTKLQLTKVRLSGLKTNHDSFLSKLFHVTPSVRFQSVCGCFNNYIWLVLMVFEKTMLFYENEIAT